MRVHTIIAQLPYTTQHTTVLIIFPIMLQTVIIVHMMSTRGEVVPKIIDID